MAFPITVNGNTYNRVDFESAGRDKVLGRFLYDVSQHIKDNRRVSTQSSSLLTLGTGLKSFTVPSGLGIQPRMFFIAVGYMPDNSPRLLLSGFVQTYSGTNLLTTVSNQFVFDGKTAVQPVRWEIAVSGWPRTVLAEPNDRINLDDRVFAEELKIVNDFILPPTGNRSYPYGVDQTVSGNSGSIVTQRLDDPNHPGILLITPAEEAGVALSMERVDLGVTDSMFRVCFRIEGAGNGHLSAGFRGYDPAIGGGTAASMMTRLGPPRGPALRSNLKGKDTVQPTFFGMSYTGTEPAGLEVIRTGAWHSLTVKYEATFDNWSADLTDLDGHNNWVHFFSGIPSGTTNRFVPYILFWRDSGRPLTLEVDYMEVRSRR